MRIIPALAGNTRTGVRPIRRHPDHPRSRGEYAFLEIPDKGHFGSSPLSRGIRRASSHLRAASGIIPALAGNTSVEWPRLPGDEDHPRSRGEYKDCIPWLKSLGGSSSLSRGIPQLHIGGGDLHRIIPALAGNTPLWTSGAFCSSDHPRSRGEYAITPQRGASRAGIIPALAGNTQGRWEWVFPIPDHPRSRGEYHYGRRRTAEVRGSSPLSRGIRQQAGFPQRLERIIPALAGNTQAGSHEPLRQRDHPRSRGEYKRKPAKPTPKKGSSPLSRGIL